MAPHADFAALKAGLDVRAGGRIIAARGEAFATGTPLDEALNGGLPRGSIATLEGGASSGRSALAGALTAAATAAGWAAWIDDGSLYPPALERAGVVLERFVLAPAGAPLAAARCADALLRSRSFGLVVMPMVRLRPTVWSRLGGLAQRSGALLVVLGGTASPELAAFASTRISCAIEAVAWDGPPGLFAALAGYEVGTRVLKSRRSRPGACVRITVGAVGARRRRELRRAGEERAAAR